MAKKMYRQGDVLVIERDAENMPEGVAEVARDNGRVILAYGEVTGHAHAITEPDVKLFAAANDDATTTVGDRFLSAPSGAVLRHEEHGRIELPAGEYIVRIQREYSPEAIRNVAD